MSELAGFSGARVIRKLERAGYDVVRQKGSHVRLRHFDSSRMPLTVPLHKELKIGLLLQLIHGAGLDVRTFLDL